MKLDGDGQMNPAFVPTLVKPLKLGLADCAKGNRFFSPENLEGMPALRLIGNAALSFMTKFTTGFWNVMDPTNGYTAIHADALKKLPLEKIDRGYFFECDILFQLNLLRAVVTDVAMDARYRDEISSLRIRVAIFSFPGKFLTRFFKRIFHQI